MNRFIWREDLDPTTKHVATMLADGCSDEGVCWPSVATLQAKTSLSRRAVQKALAKLEAAQLIRKVLRQDTSNFYILVIENLPLIERKRGEKEHGLFEHVTRAPDAPAPAHGGRPPRVPGAPPPRTEDALTLNEPSVEPSFLDSIAADAAGGDDEIVEFVVTRWQEAAEKHPGIQKARLPLDPARRQTIIRRTSRREQGQSPKQLWEAFFAEIERSAFLQGRAAPAKGRTDPFTLSLTWALKSANFNQIMEGVYGRDRNSIGDTHTPGGRRMGPAEQATAGAIARFRAAGQPGAR